MMNNFYPSNDVRLNEARRLLSELSVDDLQKLVNSDEETNKFIEKLPEVSLLGQRLISKLFVSFRFNNWTV